MIPYSGFWWRVLAYLIDTVVLNSAMSILGPLIGAGTLLPWGGLSVDRDTVGDAMTLLIGGMTLFSNWLYFSLLECSKLQGTAGKLAVGLVVTDEHGARITFLRATGRYFAKYLSALIFGIGFVMVAFSARKQGLHDKIASTLVYKTRDPRAVQSLEGVFA